MLNIRQYTVIKHSLLFSRPFCPNCVPGWVKHLAQGRLLNSGHGDSNREPFHGGVKQPPLHHTATATATTTTTAKCHYSPAWVMQAVGEYFRRLVGAVKVRVVPWYSVGGRTAVCVHVHPQHRAREVTALRQTEEQKNVEDIRKSVEPTSNEIRRCK